MPRTHDPYPDQGMLTLAQTARFVGLKPAELREYMMDPEAGFPSPKKMGKSGNGKPRLMFFKWQVQAWMDFQAMREEQEREKQK